MIWYLRRRGTHTKEQWVALAIFSARQVLDIYEKRNPKNLIPRQAIEAAARWLKEPTEANKRSAAAAYASAYASDAASAVADAAAYAAAAADEWKWQASKIREIVGACPFDN
jgi:hypothetical protein